MKIYFIAALLCLCEGAFCQTVSPDSSYGITGKVITNLSNDAPFFTFCSGKQSGGKMIAGGSSLTRILPNGKIDSSFGTNGLALKAGFPEINSLAVQNDDKIVCISNDYSEVILQRFTADGNIDSSFNGMGKNILGEQGSIINISKLRLQQDGKILLAGSILGTKSSFFVARYLTDGTPDLSFNVTGQLTLDISTDDNVAYDIAEQSTGKLIVAGAARSDFAADAFLAVVRLNADGSRDFSFNGTGILQYSNIGEAAHLLYTYSNDKILVAGSTGNELLLMRLSAEGIPDNSFNGDGILTEAGLGISLPKQIDVLSDSSVFISGQTSAITPFNWDYAVFKFTDEGLPDSSFNGTGKTFLPAAGNDYYAGGIVTGDGSILLTGYNDDPVFTNTAMIGSDGIFDVTHGDNGLQTLRINGTDETIYTILKQADNKLVAIGNRTDALANIFNTVLVRYNTDGSIDSSFANNGVCYITEPGFVFHSAVLQADDKILLTGDKYVGDPGFESAICITRINSDGTMDGGFGNNGFSLMSPSYTSGFGKGIGLLSDGRIMVAGKDASNSDLVALFRLDSNGNTDNSFGTNGKRNIDPGFAENGLGTMIIQPDDKILLGGYTVQTNGQSAFFCMRVQTNGDTDAGFASNGIFRTPTSAGAFLELNSLLLAPGEKILLTGHVSNPSGVSSSVYLSRLLSNGTPDNSFNGTGNRSYYWNLNFQSTFVIPTAACIHPDSSIYILGDAFNAVADHQQFLIRVKQNGVLDSTISTEGSGWMYLNQGGKEGILNDIIINADSSIFVAGDQTAIGTNKDFLIASYKRLPDIPGIIYLFNGNGLWTDALNWQDEMVPPALLPNGVQIIIDPLSSGTCILNTEQRIAPGGKLVVRPGRKLVIEGNFKIGN